MHSAILSTGLSSETNSGYSRNWERILKPLLTCVSTLRTPLAAGVCEEVVVARRPRQDVVEGAAVALVPEEGAHPRDVVAVAPQPPETLRVRHQVTEVSVAAHGHHEPLKPRLCVNTRHINIQSVP